MENEDFEFILNIDSNEQLQEQEFSSTGKRIISSITIDNQIYYIDEKRDIYEKVGKIYLEIKDKKIIEKINKALTSPSNEMYIDY